LLLLGGIRFGASGHHSFRFVVPFFLSGIAPFEVARFPVWLREKLCELAFVLESLSFRVESGFPFGLLFSCIRRIAPSFAPYLSGGGSRLSANSRSLLAFLRSSDLRVGGRSFRFACLLGMPAQVTSRFPASAPLFR
jgi:hypothetical protein